MLNAAHDETVTVALFAPHSTYPGLVEIFIYLFIINLIMFSFFNGR
jgi:hypothetical protein